MKLSCTLSTGYLLDNYLVFWLQQKSGGAPKLLWRYRSESEQTKGSGVPDRFSVSKDVLSKTWFLTISGALLEDSADYHCHTWHANTYHSHTADWGRSLAQYVLTQPPSASVPLEKDTQITCLGEGIGSKAVHWYQQKPGKPPVLIIYRDDIRPSGISDRFSGSNSGNTATLSLAQAQAEDEGSFAQYVLRQPPSVSVSLQQDTQIACSGDNVQDQYVHWYQQKPGKPPGLIIFKDSERPSGISDRFSGSSSGNTAVLSLARALAEDEADYYCQDTPSNTCHLTITGTLAEDEADYYCAIEYDGQRRFHGGTVQWGSADAQPVLTQPEAESVPPGNTVRLPCAWSSGTKVSGYHMGWYQQKPGNPPRYLLWYLSDSDKHHGSGVPSRFSGSKDSASNTGYLTITGALAEDEADYYCATWHGNSGTFHTDVP
ncbi:hypothetical protein lerEdw1_003684 [Lerista edwardsae]|nr:hypothetical protein lerEdw1_003684 [Lerista edwardsae]